MDRQFDKKELEELKFSLNEMISNRWIYLNMITTPRKEVNFSKMKLIEDYKLLEKVLELIDEEESI